ncbi:b(0,+)-type amino acid transporter 1-like [Malaya genurostris]|uniref:b(0,+)-type amino acid transporter 1-like n=1 Tax=Malaya genurostris TaxID=325434 RepID=UPI0026F3C100|nr:b(0,+)-type amino acid transporter 1-like [Malaya genurostris]XP_058462092.1 b(0,+)-type amino acid transporter 1-like [Malaya genurostris]XP_058462093.1 b(0,+)-type amino acid transporter 1-like [Malaya genurostris]XP_058462094.1 b(0,+)-type amino acid transporter 1-like [Malaya genurostris]
MTPAPETKTGGLKREMGLMSAINVIISVMIGSGIFVSPTAALRYSGSVGFCLVIWAVCGVISLLGALCFAELGTVVPRSGAEYAYLIEAFRKSNKFWGPLPSFICSWVYVMVLRPAEVAVIILTFAEYSILPFSNVLGLNNLPAGDLHNLIKLIAILGLGIITYINLSSVKLYVTINNIFGFCKVLACLVVIFGGIYQLAIGRTENLTRGFEGSNFSAGPIALAFYNGLWAYDGWSSVTIITEEIKKPEKNIPRSIVIAVPVITALYVFMNMAYMTVLSPEEMIQSEAVGLDFGERVLGSFAFLIPLGVALATFGCALSIQFGVTRLCYVAGQEGQMLESLSYIHMRRMTPTPAVAMQGLLALMFILVGNIEELIELASFFIWFFYGSAVVALFSLRRTQPHIHRPYKVPLIVPIITLAVSIFLSVVPIVSDPSLKYFFAIGFILIGVAVYTPFVYYKLRPKWMDKATYLVQVLFEAVPTSEKSD